MKKFYLLPLFAIASCLSEKNIDPGTPQTFVKYYNGGYNDEANDIKQTADGGFILLATTEARATDVSAQRFKIKLVKTDEFGNMQWSRVYPDYDLSFDPLTDDDGEPNDSISFKGSSIEIIKDGAGLETGYVVVGDSLIRNATAQSHLRIMLTDLEGNITRARNIKPSLPITGSNFAVAGSAVTINASGNFVVLGSAVFEQTTKNMFLAELDANLAVQWQRTYGAGTAQLANRLFIDAQSFIYWSGTVSKNNQPAEIRFLSVPPDSENTKFDLGLGSPASAETGRDICQYGFGYAVVGTTNESGDQDILFKRLNEEGIELSSDRYGFPAQSENGFSISQTRDGGLILLGSVDSNVNFGRGGKDYYLIKVSAFGGPPEWERIFGSKNDDLGSKVLSLSDGSYILYGTTVWGGLRTLSLIKTDKLGNIE